MTEVLPGLTDPQAPLFFDVRANEGQFVSLLTAMFLTAFVHAFEPHPRNYERLRCAQAQVASYVAFCCIFGR